MRDSVRRPSVRVPSVGLPRAMALVGLLVTVTALAAIPARATYGARTTADEPQYLLSALSLAEDRDLDISDEIGGFRYLDFHEVLLPAQTAPRPDGSLVSPHDPLLPVLLAVPMGLGGWMAAKATLAVLAGVLAALLLWIGVRRIGLDLVPTAVVVGGFGVSPPLVSYGSQVYPELPAALAAAVVLAALLSDPTWRTLAVGVTGVVALPWLAVKYTPVAAVLATLLLAHHQNDRAVRWWRPVAGATALAGAGIVFLVVHQRVYGGWTAYAAGDHFVGGELDVVGTDPDHLGRSRRLLGLLVDREFGLVAWAPAYVLAFPGVVWCVRTRRRVGVLFGLPLAAGWATATWIALTMHGYWWPGRQVVHVAPFAVLAVAVLVDRFRRLVVPVVVASAISLASWLWLVIEASTDRRTLIVDFADTANPAYRAWSVLLPDHRRMATVDVVLSVVWVAVLGALAIAAGRAPRDQPSASVPMSSSVTS